ncbi:hypothetical protein ACKF11_08865 [Methylobacillus sp. Pita2]|uniref:hypothetical protein n=1 Tax=Methylobacillus sp. Pita2 TaxID=3383245 RepID=UPI0038B62D8B
MASLCACTGWTWHYVMHELDVPRLAQFEAYYGKHPPLHLMVAAYLGVKPADPAPAVAAEVDDGQLEHLLQHIPLSKPEPYLTAEEYLERKRQKNGG